jgi:hypothetical protein
MIDGNTLLSEVGSKYGAQMGRRTIEKNPKAKVTLFLMRMVDGAYDTGGAYWGGSSTDKMYAAIGEGFEYYTRANSLHEAKLHIQQIYPKLQIELTEINDDFVDAYITAALMYSTDDSDEDNGDEVALFDNYDFDDIAPEAMERIVKDCRDFLTQYGHLINSKNCIEGEEFQLAGYDFFHTRTGSGVGFWDGDWEEPEATALTKACQKFGHVDFYVGDDKKIYVTPA